MVVGILRKSLKSFAAHGTVDVSLGQLEANIFKYPPGVMHTPREVDARPHGLSEKTLCVRKRLRVPILATEL